MPGIPRENQVPQSPGGVAHQPASREHLLCCSREPLQLQAQRYAGLFLPENRTEHFVSCWNSPQALGHPVAMLPPKPFQTRTTPSHGTQTEQAAFQMRVGRILMRDTINQVRHHKGHSVNKATHRSIQLAPDAAEGHDARSVLWTGWIESLEQICGRVHVPAAAGNTQSQQAFVIAMVKQDSGPGEGGGGSTHRTIQGPARRDPVSRLTERHWRCTAWSIYPDVVHRTCPSQNCRETCVGRESWGRVKGGVFHLQVRYLCSHAAQPTRGCPPGRLR